MKEECVKMCYKWWIVSVWVCVCVCMCVDGIGVMNESDQ